MSNTTKTAAEKKFQEDVTQRLTLYKWAAPDFLNGNKHKVTVSDLIQNWRKELNRLNADALENVPLTDNEFQQVMNHVKSISNSFEAAKLLAMENSTGKIDGIIRDTNLKVSRKSVTLTIFRKADVGGGDSNYQIAREVTSNHGNRFDMILLINGLPLINIELKRADVSLDEAFEQFKRYYRAGEYVNGFMAFSQMMVCMSPVETRYFATPKSIKRFNPSFVFHWANKNNTPVNNWETIVDSFLRVPMAHQMVGDYLVIDNAEDAENACHLLLRPYQVYALQSIELAAGGLDNKDGIKHGGYIWHTTGAGKTLTSFKTALFLSIRGGLDKIIFMVDRRELDKTTGDRFKEYATYEPVIVDDTKSTYDLRRKLKHPGIIVTTTFKMSSLVKNLVEANDDRLKEKRFIFIIDEAHRTTMGEMLKGITSYFRRNSLFYGFTGTPLFDENHVKGMVNEKSEAIRTTEALFGKCLHKYTIDQAIADKNVLGFHVKYLNTGEFAGYDDLRKKLREYLVAQDPQMTKRKAEETVAKWDELKVETEADKYGLFIYQDETHIPRVVERILSSWEEQSQNRTFNAILTVAYKKRVLTYYQEFKKQLEGVENPIHIAMTVSFGNPNDPDRLEQKFIEEMFADYASYTGVSFIPGDAKTGEDAYYRDLVERGRRGGSGRNEHNIDLIIVADQMLTGWDDKYLNTLYNDRMLELQGLIQAYSRTNRVLGRNKEFGTIINFMRPKQTEAAVNEALKLYGSGGKSSRVIVDTYDVAVDKLKECVVAMRLTLPDPTEWQQLESDDEGKKAFLKAFRSTSAQLVKVEQYYEFVWDDARFGITEEEWLYYIGAYKNLRDKGDGEDDDPIIIELPGAVTTVGITVVNAAYIIKLIGEKTKSVHGISTLDQESLRLLLEKIQDLKNHGEIEQAKLLDAFVRAIVAGEIPANNDADAAFTSWKKEQMVKTIHVFAKKWGADETLLSDILESYDFIQKENDSRVGELISTLKFPPDADPLDYNDEFVTELSKWLRDTTKLYKHN